MGDESVDVVGHGVGDRQAVDVVGVVGDGRAQPLEGLLTGALLAGLLDLAGAEVDFKEDLQGSRFVVSNPNASTTCGCGNSFSIA